MSIIKLIFIFLAFYIMLTWLVTAFIAWLHARSCWDESMPKDGARMRKLWWHLLFGPYYIYLLLIDEINQKKLREKEAADGTAKK